MADKIMSKSEIKEIALAFTAKTSTSTSIESFVNDYKENLQKLQDIEDIKPRVASHVFE